MPFVRVPTHLLAVIALALGLSVGMTRAQEAAPVQAPALLGAPPISPADRVYTADQVSNTVSVIDPSTNTLLGTIPLGKPRLGPLLSPIYYDEVNVHGLGFAPDGALLDVISVTTNSATLIDTATNQIAGQAYLGRAPHEGFISPDGTELWVAVRGENYVAVLDVAAVLAAGAAEATPSAGTGGVGAATPQASTGGEVARIATGPGPGMVVFSPDGAFAYVNHSESAELVKIDVASHQVVGRLTGLVSPFSPNLAVSPDGKEVWLTHKDVGKVTVIDAASFQVLTVLDTGPVTNHVNFVTKPDAAYAYVTVGGMDATLVYRRNGANPERVAEIKNSGSTPHGIWPSPDNTRVYVGLENADAVDVIDTDAMTVVATIKIGQSPQALVYVAGAAKTGGGGEPLSRQGLDLRIETLQVEVEGQAEAKAKAFVRELPTTDMIEVTGRDLPPGAVYTVLVGNDGEAVPVGELAVTPKGQGMALAFTGFFDRYDRVRLVPKGEEVSAPASPAASPAASMAGGETVTVDIGDNFYEPAMVTVPVGGSVTWTNGGAEPHTATARDRDVLQSGTLKQDERYTETFEAAGTYEYFCEFHPNMKGTLVVE
ncbi:MAG: cupredoxin domain-containing protein [Chloroflexota bacterium]|nr:cupredoxin domain-containing protein [Chloroflexota bacterium]